eukprot:Rmarinus@m.24808
MAPKVLVILGTTAVGKTKLSLELASALGAEIVSADSMQVYRGLDIASAKATKEEQGVAQHHLLDVVNPEDKFTVLDYRNLACEAIEKISSKGKLAIVVGGTNYYIEALVSNELQLDDRVEGSNDFPSRDNGGSNDFESLQTAYKKLLELDPESANRIHPNDERKIRRYLEICEKHGVPASKLHSEKREIAAANMETLGYDCTFLYLKSDLDVLDERIGKRVDGMVESGILEEVESLYDRIKSKGLPPTYGVLQAIGYKEFSPYLDAKGKNKTEEEVNEILAECLETLKCATRRYARKQIRWIRNKFIAKTNWPIYLLDSSDVALWDANVFAPALSIAKAFLEGSTPQVSPISRDPAVSPDVLRRECDICGGRVILGRASWEAHEKSKAHKRNKKRRAKEGVASDEISLEIKSKKMRLECGQSNAAEGGSEQG